MKKRSIKTSILLPAIAVLVVGITLMVIIVGTVSSSTANDLTERLVNARVNEYTNEFRAMTMDTYGVVEALTPIVADYSHHDTDTETREEVEVILADAMMANANMLAIWTCWEPNAFDGRDGDFAGTQNSDSSGRFVSYIFKDGDSYGTEALEGYDDPVSGEFYQGPLTTGKPYITDPYYYTVGGQQLLIYSIAIPILENGTSVGVVGADINMQDLINAMNAGSILDDGYLYTLSPTGLVATHSNPDLLLQHYDTTWMSGYSAEVENAIATGESFYLTAYSDVTNTHMQFLGSGVMIGDTGRYWVICGVVPEKTVSASSTQLIWMVIAIGVGLIVIVGATIFLIVRNRLKQLPNLSASANAMALGDISASELDIDRDPNTKNEIALVGQAFERMASGISEQADVVSKIALGDYSMDIPIRSDKDVMNIALNEMLDRNNVMISEIREAATQVSSASAQIAAGAQGLASGSTQQAASIEEFSATVNQIQAQSIANTDLADQTLADTNEAGRLMEESIGYMGQLNAAMGEIGTSSQEISKVIKVIDDIAFQTNILALNAAVEAARAGQHGKGFAVVADEVRNLASKSAGAAKETSALIDQSSENVERGTKLAEKTSESLNRVGTISASNAENMRAMSEASKEQSSSINEVNEGINQISQVVQSNSATAEQSAAASEEMSAQSDMLTKNVAQFKLRDRSQQRSLPAHHANSSGDAEKDTDVRS